MSEKWNLSMLCRCCHKDVYFKSLDEAYQAENYVETCDSMLQVCLGITMIRPTGQRSYVICEDCKNQMHMARMFKLQVLTCEEKFKEDMKNELFQVKCETESNNENNIEGDTQRETNIIGFEENTIEDAMPNSNDTHAILDDNFFQIINSSSSNIVAVCIKCLPNRVEIKDTLHSTVNFKTHLKRKHGNDAVSEYETYVTSKRSKIDQSPQLTVSPHTSVNCQADFDRNLVKYFISAMVPLLSIEDPCFKHLIQSLRPGTHIMDRRNLGRMITQFFVEERRSIKQELLAGVEDVCVTIDIWTGCSIILGVTVHWLNSNTFKRTSRALACERLKNIKVLQDYEKVYQKIKKICTKFQLDERNVPIYVNCSGNSFVEEFKSFGVHKFCVSNDLVSKLSCAKSQSDNQVSDRDNEDTEISLVEYLKKRSNFSFECTIQSLNLCAIEASKVLYDQNTTLSTIHRKTMKRCTRLWQLSRTLPSGQLIRDILGKNLDIPDATRWISIYECLNEIFSIKNKSEFLHKALKLKKQILESEFLYIKEYLTCTKPIADAIQILEDQNATYYGILFPTVLTLRSKLRRLIGDQNSLKYCFKLAKSYLSCLESNFKDLISISTKEAQIAALAAFTHPKYKKLKWACLLEESQIERIKNLLIEKVYESMPPESLTPIPRLEGEDYFEFDSDSESKKEKKYLAERIVSLYLSENVRDIGILNIHYEIKKLFLKYNTPLPTIGFGQQMFSGASITNCNIDDISEMFERRIVLKNNMKYS